MRFGRVFGVAAVLLGTVGLVAPAGADVAPGPRPRPTPRPVPQDPSCTEGEVRREGEECSRCQNTDSGCVPRMIQSGFERRCSTRSYTILCAAADREPTPTPVAKDPEVAQAPEVTKPEQPTPAAPPPTAPADPPWPPTTDSGGCACDATSPGTPAAAFAVALLALLAATRRR